MKSPFLKYVFTCKHCSHESACRLDVYSKKKLFEIIKKDCIDQCCLICGHEDNYHFDRLYTKPSLWPVVLIWLIAIPGSYFLGMYYYGHFEDLDGPMQRQKIIALAIAFLSPIVLAVLFSGWVFRAKSKFNNSVSEIH